MNSKSSYRNRKLSYMNRKPPYMNRKSSYMNRKSSLWHEPEPEVVYTNQLAVLTSSPLLQGPA